MWFDWANVQLRAADDNTLSAVLSPVTRNLIIDALQIMLERYAWGVVSDAVWDEIEAATSAALRETQMNTAIGQIIWRIGGIQSNELLCDGSIYNRVDYPDLYAVLDAAYIIDADSFKVPDLTHKMLVGEGSGWAVGDTGGVETVTLTTTEMPSHTHTNTPHTHTEIIAVAALINGGVEAPAAAAVPGASVTGATGVVIDNTGGDAAHENMPPYEVVTPVVVAF